MEVENRIAMEAVLNDDYVRNLRIAKLSEKAQSKRCSVYKCNSLICCITEVDTSVNWIECDNCDKWVHTMYLHLWMN